jgi:hypothetical protein
MRAHNLVLNTLKCVSPELNVDGIFSSARKKKATIHPLANRTAKAWSERASDVWVAGPKSGFRTALVWSDRRPFSFYFGDLGNPTRNRWILPFSL